VRLLALAFFLCAAPLRAQTIDDSDLSTRGLPQQALQRLETEGRPGPGLLLFPLRGSGLKSMEGTSLVVGRMLLANRQGEATPARLARVRLSGAGAPEIWAAVNPSGGFSLKAPENPSGAYRLRVSLDNQFWTFQKEGGSSYAWESQPFGLAPDSGLDLGTLMPDSDSENAKLSILHLTFLEAMDFLMREADMVWWKKPLTVYWPEDSDFFSPWGWSLSLTNPLAWDVVLHELGHAVMHGAMRAKPAGGPHKIDECYSRALAWSEGWATFFAAAVRLSRDDPDAKFEFLVPRRAPIRIENVPEDVCQGPSNEWRVAAGLWDLWDIHPDGGDQFSMTFPLLWKSLAGKSTDSLGSAWGLIAQNLNPLEKRDAEEALIQNTLLPPRPPLAVRLPSPPAEWLDK